jgi:ankyrin repeat protein
MYDIADLLLKNGARTDITCKHNGTPLHLAASGICNSNFITLLLNYKADIDVLALGGETPLHLAAYENNIEAIKTLVAGGANINAQNKEKLTPLLLAIGKMNIHAVYMLCKLGADRGIKDIEGRTAYDYCRLDELLQKLEEDNIITI